MSDENGGKASMTPGDSPSPDQDQPIFSLRYNKWKVLWRIGHICFVFLIFYKIVFDWSINKDFFLFFFSQIVGVSFLILMMFSLYDVIFTREIILNRWKIIKVWRFGLKREIEFVCARFRGNKNLFCSTKSFYPYWTKSFLRPILWVFYDETLASNKDVRRMNQLLAEISGRDINLFEGGGMFSTRSTSLKSFLKEGIINER